MDQALEAWQKVNNPPTDVRPPLGPGHRPGQDYEAGLLRRAAGAEGQPGLQGHRRRRRDDHRLLRPPARGQGPPVLARHLPEAQDQPGRGDPGRLVQPARPPSIISPDNAIGTYKRLNASGGFEYGVTGIPYFKDGAQICHTDSWHYGARRQQRRTRRKRPSSSSSSPARSARRSSTTRFGQLPAHVDLLNTLPDYQKIPAQAGRASSSRRPASRASRRSASPSTTA